MRRICTIAVGVAVAGAACAAQFEGAELAPENSGAHDASVKTQSFKVHFAPRAATAPKLDGKLDDACWQGVEPISDFGPRIRGTSYRRTKVKCGIILGVDAANGLSCLWDGSEIKG